MDGKKIALVQALNQCISARDLGGLARSMTDDHVFIDSAGGTVVGKENALRAWKGFFAAFPDYRNVFEKFVVTEDRVAILGYSICSDARLDGPAIWTAKISGAAISEWRVYEDDEETRARLGVAEQWSHYSAVNSATSASRP